MQNHNGISLNHLDRMTDSTGLIQHAIFSLPRRESGYTTDDNARALRLCVRLWSLHPDEPMLKRVSTYLSFLEFARGIGRGFHNFLSYDRRWLDAEGGGDCQGQAIRALADVLGSNLPDGYRALARELIEAVLPELADLRSLRAQAYIILAWGHLRRMGVQDIEPLESVAWSAAKRLVECYSRTVRPDWQWFESRMTYANAVLPHALFIAAKHWPEEAFLEIAKASFAFLDHQTTAPAGCSQSGKDRDETEKVSWPVGNEGWYPHGEEKALYDQQPVEAVTMAEAALAAFELQGDEKYLDAFGRSYGWFHGQNSLHQPLADIHSGACCDGLQASGINRNQGAESTLAYLWTELLNSEISQLSRTAGQIAPLALWEESSG
jgi:hypothetical protein